MTSREPWKAQRIGNLRERVAIFASTGGIEAIVWARMEPAKAYVADMGGPAALAFDVTFHIRHRDGLAVGREVGTVRDGRRYRIVTIRNLDERRRFLALDCVAP